MLCWLSPLTTTKQLPKESICTICPYVPGRTGLDIPVSVYSQLASISNIAGVKEASNDITKIIRIRHACGPDFAVWSGNDDQIVPAMSVGGSGVISVLSNLYPLQTQAMCDAALSGDFKTASNIQCQFLPLIDSLFSEVNPIPVKAAMNELGYDCGGCRLPLCPMQPDKLKALIECL